MITEAKKPAPFRGKFENVCYEKRYAPKRIAIVTPVPSHERKEGKREKKGVVLRGFRDEDVRSVHLIHELSTYGVFIPRFKVFENTRNLAVSTGISSRHLVVVQKVEGLPLDVFLTTHEAKKGKGRSEIDQLFAHLTQYYSDKYDTGGEYLDDIAHTTQFVYGSTAQSDIQKVYLVDIEPLHGIMDASKRDGPNGQNFIRKATQLIYTVKEIEGETGKPCVQAREELAVFLKKIDRKSWLGRHLGEIAPGFYKFAKEQ